MFWRMNSDTYEVSKFVLIGRCATRGRRGRNFTNLKSGSKICALILTLKHWSRELTQNGNTSYMYLKTSGEFSWRLVAPAGHINNKKLTVLLVRRVLHHGIKNVGWTPVFVYFNYLERSKWLEVMKANHYLLYKNWDIDFHLFLFILF